MAVQVTYMLMYLFKSLNSRISFYLELSNWKKEFCDIRLRYTFLPVAFSLRANSALVWQKNSPKENEWVNILQQFDQVIVRSLIFYYMAGPLNLNNIQNLKQTEPLIKPSQSPIIKSKYYFDWAGCTLKNKPSPSYSLKQQSQ